MARNQDLSAQEVLDICSFYMNDKSLAFVTKALEFATEAHEGQMRLSGEPYIIHPIQVAGILAQLQMDPDTVATGFLHDVAEDTDVTLDEIEAEFSPTVRFLVDGVTKLGKVKFQSKEEALAENHRKMLLAMANDIRVIIVKLADRLHNMRTMKYQRREKQIEKSEEAIEIYAPLADRIGMNNMKWELEDISLRYIHPDGYYKIVRLMDSRRTEREEYIQAVINEVNESLKELDIQADIYGRPKHIYSIYRKMKDQEKEFEDIFDLLAIRVLVDSVKDCYAVLGAVHTIWKPMPGRFKDYIAMPKANMYQSLHTTVIGPEGKPVEIQIRTYQMHEVAEYGVAAHWAYKEGRTDKVEEDSLTKQLNWFKQIIELQDEVSDASEFMDFVKEDIFKDQVYIFTPQGDVMELPKDSGPIDFAYHIHTEVGNKVVGAKVNGNIVPLDYTLKNGDIVEILTNSNAKPSHDWLKLTKTNKARNRIKHYFKSLARHQNAENGQNIMERELRANKRTLREFSTRKIEDKVKKRFNFNSMDDLYAAIGREELAPQTIISYLGWRREPEEKEITKETVHKTRSVSKPKQISDESGVVVEGAENLMIRLSQCCNPVPGDEIVGYITRGRGISVHRSDCPNLLAETQLSDRTIDVHWAAEQEDDQLFETEIEIIAFDRNGLINDILHVVDHTVKNLFSVNARTTPDSEAIVTIKVGIQDTEALEDLMNKLRNIPDVYQVERVVK